MTADYAALAARVAELEQQMRHMLPAKIDAVSFAVSLVHEDMRYLREQSDIHGAALERQEGRLDRQGELLGSLNDRLERQEARLDRQGELLGSLNDRLERQEARLERQEARLERQEALLDQHGELLGSLNDRLERQETRLERQETQLDHHGELLEEILRRLPSGPPAP